MSKLVDVTGQRFGRLQVLGRSKSRPTIRHKAAWVCQCDCGDIVIVAGQDMRDGRVKSCGCLKKQLRKNRVSKRAEDAKTHFYIDREFDDLLLE